jgi:putative copper export protein/mono/diheme cytochrome c family protein
MEAGDAMDGFLIAARAVHYAATISLAGVFAFLTFIAGPSISPRVIRRLRLLAWASLALALCSGMAWLVAVSANMSGEPFADVLSQGVLPTVLTGTRFGQVWMWRFAVAVVLAVVLLAPEGWHGRLWRWSGLVCAAGLLASLAWAGHGAATPGAPGNLHLAADILHLLAAGAWVGSLVPLALLLAEARRSGDAAARLSVRRIVMRYSILAAASVVVLFTAGLINTWFLAGTVPALIGTEYGRFLLLKITIFLVMVVFGAVNLLRMTPRLAVTGSERRPLIEAALDHLRRNASVEALLGLCVLGIVAVIGTLPPGLHTEPGWPLPFRLELAALPRAAHVTVVILAAMAGIFALCGVATAAAGRYRVMAAAWAGVLISAAICFLVGRPAIAPAYPTSFLTPAQPYAAASVVKGARLYAENCALCHGVDGGGDGPAAAALPIPPTDLLAPHLFAHTPGDLFWWVSHGEGGGAMPGFAGRLSAANRWDVINFLRARAAGSLSRGLGSEISPLAAPAMPDFAFTTDARQQTLSGLEKTGPTLVVLFSSEPRPGRLAQLAAARESSAAAGLQIVAIDLAPGRVPQAGNPADSPLVAVSPAVAATLQLFRAPDDGGETDLMLDRAGHPRARWTANGSAGLPNAETLIAEAARIGQFPAAAENHSGHGG